MGTSGSFKIVRTTASYFFSPSGHGKWAKTLFFRIFANFSNAKIFKRYPRMPYESWRPAGSENVVVFVAIIFLNQSYGCSKSTESESKSKSKSEFVIKIMRWKKNRYALKKKFQDNFPWEKFLNPILKLLSAGFGLNYFLPHIFMTN